MLSKRFLTELVRQGRVDGWDDPRMPTLAGLRRRGVPAAAIRDFARRVGVARANSLVDVAMFDHAVREHLNKMAPRRMAVLRPLKLVIENYPEGAAEEIDAVNNPEDPGAGTRRIPFGRELYVERDDFMENPPNNFFRLAPGREVRLRYAYFVTCREVVKNRAGEVVELICTYDPATRGGNAPDGRKVRATLHWVDAASAVPAEIRLYNALFTRPDPGAAGDFFADLNPQFARSTDREPARAGACRRATGRADAVRAPGLFLPRPRLAAGPSGLQPHRRPARQLGQGASEWSLAEDADIVGVDQVGHGPAVEVVFGHALVGEILPALVLAGADRRA